MRYSWKPERLLQDYSNTKHNCLMREFTQWIKTNNFPLGFKPSSFIFTSLGFGLCIQFQDIYAAQFIWSPQHQELTLSHRHGIYGNKPIHMLIQMDKVTKLPPGVRGAIGKYLTEEQLNQLKLNELDRLL